MNIVFLCTKYPLQQGDSWLTSDLAKAMAQKGHCVSVCFLDWQAEKDQEEVIHVQDNIKVLYYPAIRLNGVSGVKRVLLQVLKWFFGDYWATKFFLKNLDAKNIDGIVNFSPATPFKNMLPKLTRMGAPAYFVLWDFFPFHQRALGLIKPALAVKIFLGIETRLINLHKVVGCMTPRNVEYLKFNYKLKEDLKVEVLSLWGPTTQEKQFDRDDIRSRWGISKKSVLSVFGGQLVAGRGLESVIELAKEALSMKLDSHFVIIGSGPLEAMVRDIQKDLPNLSFYSWVDRTKYFELLKSADIGFVFLQGNEGMPSFPSKSIDYMRASLPILASCESSTDFGEIIQDSVGAGLASLTGDFDGLKRNFIQLYQDRELRVKLGSRGETHFKENCTAESAANQILNYFGKG